MHVRKLKNLKTNFYRYLLCIFCVGCGGLHGRGW